MPKGPAADKNKPMHQRPRVWIYEDLYGAFDYGRLKMCEHELGGSRGEMYMPVAKAKAATAKAVKQRDEELRERLEAKLGEIVSAAKYPYPHPSQPTFDAYSDERDVVKRILDFIFEEADDV